jgi:hypothetical protein
MTYPFSEDNRTSRAALGQFVGGLSAKDLTREASAGWTVAATLAHMAFWDRRMTVLLRRWTEAGAVGDAPVDADMINDALVPLFRALEPQAAVEQCLAAAAEVDAALEAMSPALYEQIQASGVYFRFNRSLHRQGHLAEIAHALGRG